MEKTKNQIMKQRLATLAAIVGCTLISIIATTCAEQENVVSSRVLESAFCTTTPMIDGRIGPDEWTVARVVSLEMDYYDSRENRVDTHAAKVYLMNSREELFVGLTVAQEEYDGTWSEEPGKASLDVFMILFDANDEGVLGSGEDKKFLSLIGGMSIYSDQHQLSEEEERDGKEEGDEPQHGAGAITHSNTEGIGDYTAEFRIPLSSGDAFDINAEPGAKLRWNIVAFDKFGSDINEISFGALSDPNLDNSSGWGYLTLGRTRSAREVSDTEFPPGRSPEQEKVDIETELDLSVIPKGSRAVDYAGPWDLPLLAPGNHLTIQRAEEFKFSPAVEAELNAKWDTAVARGADIAMVGVDWRAVERAPGVYDKAQLEEPLKACQAKGLQPVLLLTTIDSEGYYAMPADFVDPNNDDKLVDGMHIDDPEIVTRYKAVLDWVVPMLLKYDGFLLSIANEPESIFGTKPAEQQQFVNFLIAAREHVRTITEDLPVTAALTRAVLTGDLDNVIVECDVAYFNYYGQGDDFEPEPPSMVSQRIDELLAVAKGRQLLLQETGMPAGYEDKPSSINATPELQRQFFENVIAKLQAEPRFRGACVFLMPDMPEEFSSFLEQLYLEEGLPKSLTTQIRESFETVGLCRNTDGSAKPAWGTFLDGLDMIYGSKDNTEGVKDRKEI